MFRHKRGNNIKMGINVIRLWLWAGLNQLRLKPDVGFFFFHIRTVHLDIIKVVYSPTNAQVTVLRTLLKFTLK